MVNTQTENPETPVSFPASRSEGKQNAWEAGEEKETPEAGNVVKIQVEQPPQAETKEPKAQIAGKKLAVVFLGLLLLSSLHYII